MNPQAHSARECGDAGVSAGRGPGQVGWYHWLASQVSGCSVLDVGCGLGYGLDILRAKAAHVSGQDLDSRLGRPDVFIGPVDALPGKSADVVVSVDVIEHIEDDGGFLAQLVRLARRRVMITTPNWTAGRAKWPYHIREYTPAQLRALCGRFGRVQLFKGTPDGGEVHPIAHPVANDLLNRTRVMPAIGSAVRVWNATLPRRSRIHSHLAAVITLPE